MGEIEFSVRVAEAFDIEALGVLGAQTFRETYAQYYEAAAVDEYTAAAFSISQMEAELADPGSQFLVVENTGASPNRSLLVGYAKLKLRSAPDCVPGSSPVELERIYLLRSHHGKGLGHALWDRVMKEAALLGCDAVWLGVWPRNARAITFYEQRGFRAVGTKTFEFAGELQEDRLMVRDVPNGL